ncbi:class I SAM-dependent methyltransferase [Calycomorphotria hydatis]|uniref:Methyltransferase domain protein n=1 Tax=Calycomorphotria hydatis TaxID=2528027 RepID=A0A517TDW2_9PLAN|nr:class I SAM-dependent methyltransferase [Calycomorphotria hydatis]QDT66563.1 Methyltransferase domain protein [Calycomorphotria hydatis]
MQKQKPGEESTGPQSCWPQSAWDPVVTTPGFCFFLAIESNLLFVDNTCMNDNTSQQLDPQTHAGQAVYTPRMLKLYDFIVHGVSNRWIWRCPTARLHELYQQVGESHADIGVGTGLFLDRCRFPVDEPRVMLIDLNQDCLTAASQRIARYQPKTVVANVLKTPLPIDEQFDSVGLMYLLHCLPGSMNEKGPVVFENAKQLLKPGGVLFGATLLGQGVPRNWFAKRLMATYNRKGIFSNTEDSPEALEAALRERFEEVTVELVGCAAIFTARNS